MSSWQHQLTDPSDSDYGKPVIPPKDTLLKLKLVEKRTVGKNNRNLKMDM